MVDTLGLGHDLYQITHAFDICYGTERNRRKKSQNSQIDCHRLRRKLYVLEYIKENIYVGTELNRTEQNGEERRERNVVFV